MYRGENCQAEQEVARVGMLGRRRRIVATVMGAVVLLAGNVTTTMGVAVTGNADVRMMVKQIKLDGGQDVAAARRAWANQYGQDVSQMPDLPDIAAATPEQRAAAVDLLARSRAATAAYVDPAKAEEAGYDNFQVALAVAEQQQPTLASRMQQIDVGALPPGTAMVHVGDKHRNNTVLDPAAPPALLYTYQGHNTWKLVGLMYFANGAFPLPPPDPGGPITRWHYHNEAPGSLMMHMYFVPDGDISDSELAHAYTKM